MARILVGGAWLYILLVAFMIGGGFAGVCLGRVSDNFVWVGGLIAVAVFIWKAYPLERACLKRPERVMRVGLIFSLLMGGGILLHGHLSRKGLNEIWFIVAAATVLIYLVAFLMLIKITEWGNETAPPWWPKNFKFWDFLPWK